MRIRNLAVAGALLLTGGTAGFVAAQPGPAAASVHRVHHLPRWVHWQYATNGQSQDCGRQKHRALLIWTSGGTTSTILCADGTSYSS